MFRIDKNAVGAEPAPFVTLQPKPIEELYRQSIGLSQLAVNKRAAEPRADTQGRAETIKTPAPVPAVDTSLITKNAEAQAEKIVKDAQAQAEKIIKDAETRVEQIFNSATIYAEGLKDIAHQEGLIQGQKEAEFQIAAQANKQAAEFAVLVHEIKDQRDNILNGVEEDVVKLVLHIARKVIHSELGESVEAYKSFIRNAIIRMRSSEPMTLRLSVDEYEQYIASGVIDVAYEYKDRNINVISDPFLEKGSCVVESNGETIDASVDTQLRRIEAAFEKEM